MTASRRLFPLACRTALLALAPACLDWGELETGRCGDGFVGPEEACDDGNDEDGDGCDARCRVEPEACGNGRPETGEQCDDGNLKAGDGCDARCAVEPPVCGDGRMETGEACDDGNLKAGDGCDARCAVEPSVCGNGRMETGEACDDGNTRSGDGCDVRCVVEPPLPSCGNGTLDEGEVCDDGNDRNDDSCLGGCSRATCGDGQVRTFVEECEILGGASETPCTQVCLACPSEPAGYFRAANGHCYEVHDERVTQENARAICQAEGAELWTVTTLDEGNQAVTRMMLTGRVWLGRLVEAEGQRWVTGESTTFAHFAPGEPSLPDVTCVAVTADGSANSWKSAGCTTKLPFVCERAAPIVRLPDNHAYRVHTAAVTADEARARCTAEGGALVALETTEERTFVAGKIALNSWVDASEAPEGSYAWPGGTPVGVDEFRPGQPDDTDGSQGCLVLEAKRRLADQRCDDAFAYVCEFE